MSLEIQPNRPTVQAYRGIDYFNRDHVLHRIKVRVALRARERMYQRVLAVTRPTRETRILDVGTTPDLQTPYNNFFERGYPHPDRLTACSIEDCSNLESAFPGLTFRRTEGVTLPFQDMEFDVALSFAVLEHVGSQSNQQRFLAELARVSHTFLVYTPYRYFPVEMHTFLPFSHWLPARCHRAFWRMLGLEFWADERNLNLLSIRTLKRLLPSFGRSKIRLLRTWGWPSNIELHWQRLAVPGVGVNA